MVALCEEARVVVFGSYYGYEPSPILVMANAPTRRAKSGTKRAKKKARPAKKRKTMARRRKLAGAALAAWRKKRGLSASTGKRRKKRKKIRVARGRKPSKAAQRRARSSRAREAHARRRRSRRVTVTVRANGRRKRRRRRSSSVITRVLRLGNPRRRRRRYRNPRTWRPGGKSGVFRPAIRRTRPSARVRKHLRQARAAGFKFNPGRMGGLGKLAKLSTWQYGLSIAAGAGLAVALPNYLAAKTGVAALQGGWGGVAFRGAVTVLAAGLVGGLARSAELGKALLGGGMAVVVVDAMRQIQALAPVTRYLPSFGLSGMHDYLALSGYGGGMGWAGYGVAGMGNALPYAGINGMGMPMTAQQLTANQAYYGRGMGAFLSLNAIGAGALPQAQQIALESAGGIH